MNKRRAPLKFIVGCMAMADPSVEIFWVPKLSKENAKEEDGNFKEQKDLSDHFSPF